MRLQWASAEIEEEWAPHLSRISKMVLDLEVLSVLEGVRKAALVNLRPFDPVWFRFREDGLHVIPLDAVRHGDYENEVVRPAPGDAVAIRALLIKDPISPPECDEDYGRLLGYPPCCTRFFEEVWLAGLKETTPSQAKFKSALPSNIYQNVTLKHLGIRPVFHLPCSFDCRDTGVIANCLKSLHRVDKEAWYWMEEILMQPYTFSIKNGIAEIVHPLFRTTYEADVPDYHLSFGVENARPANGSSQLWVDNGFTGFFEMETAHRVILDEVHGLTAHSIVDLGAGNGLLVSRIGRMLGPADLTAVESSLDKCNRGSILFPETRFVNKQIDEFDEPHDLALISINRIYEGVKPETLAKITKKHLVVYSYDHDIKTQVLPGFARLGQRHRRVHLYKRKP